jgi:hypothetical protein
VRLTLLSLADNAEIHENKRSGSNLEVRMEVTVMHAINHC